MRFIFFGVVAACAVGCATPDDQAHPLKGDQEPDDTDVESDGGDGEDGPAEDEGEDQDETEGESDGDGDGEDEEEPTVEDDAAVVWVDVPDELTCGTTGLASIEMRNTGRATWTRAEGYKLGVMNDDDDLYGPDTRVWMSDDVTVVPGESHVFDFELVAPAETGDYVTDWQMVHEDVQWFGEALVETVTVTCDTQTFCDPLTDSTVQTGFADKEIRGGSFSAAGWQTTGVWDQIRLEMSTPITGAGTFEIDVTNFDPATQYASGKHQIINMYTSDDGSQAVFETDEAWWNIRTGTNYGTGFKILAAPNGGDSREEARLIESATWDPTDTHTFTVEWDSEAIDIYLDGTHLRTLSFDGRIQPLQHVFIGKDNVYQGQVGPIYSNLCVTLNH